MTKGIHTAKPTMYQLRCTQGRIAKARTLLPLPLLACSVWNVVEHVAVSGWYDVAAARWPSWCPDSHTRRSFVCCHAWLIKPNTWSSSPRFGCSIKSLPQLGDQRSLSRQPTQLGLYELKRVANSDGGWLFVVLKTKHLLPNSNFRQCKTHKTL